MNSLKKVFLSLLLILSIATGLTACGMFETMDPDQGSGGGGQQPPSTPPTTITYTLNLIPNKSVALRGEVVTLNAYLHAEGKDDVLADGATYSIVDGASYATLAENKLTILNTANANSIVKVKAKVGATDSNVVEIKVSVPLESIVASANGVTNVLKGSSTVLHKETSPIGADLTDFKWEVIEGANLCSISGDVLVVNPNATVGSIIKVKAVCGGKESNVLEYIVGYPVTKVTASANEVTNILKGQSILLYKEIYPQEADKSDFKWEIVEGSNLCSINGDLLLVKPSAVTGSIIKVKATCGGQESEVLEFMVGYYVESVSASANGITNIKRGESVTLYKEILPKEADTDDFKWEVVEGAGLFTIAGDTLLVKANATVGAKIKVKAVCGGKESEALEFIVGYPVESITASANGVTNIIKGTNIPLSKQILPTNADIDDFKWEIVEGAGACFVNGDNLYVNATATTGTIIKVKAVCGGQESEVLEFMVGYYVESVTASASGVTNIKRGESITLYKEILPKEADTDDFKWEVVEGEGLFTITGDTLFVKSTATVGAKIKVKAVCGGKESEALEFIVGYPVESIKATAGGVTNIIKGTNIPLSKEILPTNADIDDFKWEIVEGAGACFVNGDNLHVNATATTGTIIKVKAVCGGKESEVLEFMVGYYVESVTASANGVTNILKGESVTLYKEILPKEADTDDFKWEILEGATICSINGDNLFVNSTAKTGDVIKVKATCGGQESDEFELIVGYPLKSISVEVGGSTNVPRGETRELTVTLDPVNTTEGDYKWEILEGADYCTIIDNVLTVSEFAPLDAEITFKAVGVKESSIITIVVTNAIESLSLTTSAPQILTHGANYPLQLVASPKDVSTKAVEWVVSNSDYAYVSNNTLYVYNNVPHGAELEVYAKSGNVESQKLEFNVGVALKELELELNGAVNVLNGKSITFTVTKNPADATNGEYEVVFVSGQDNCVLVGNTITIKDEATIGEKIIFKVVATNIAGIESGEVEIIVGIPVEEFTISLTAPAILTQGQYYPVEINVTPANATYKNVTWVVSKSAYAYVSNNLLFVRESVPHGATFKVSAIIDGKESSNSLIYQVGVAINSIAVSTNVKNVIQGQTATLTATINQGATEGYSWVITQGSEYASISNAMLFVNEGVETGTIIKVRAVSESGNVKSTELEFIVGIPLTALELERNGAVNVLNGNTITFAVTKKPANTTNGEYSVEFVSGQDYCVLSGNSITIKEDAPIGEEIIFKVVATNATGIESDTVKIIVGIPVVSLSISSTAPKILTHGASYPITLTTDPEDATYKNVEWFVSNKDYAYVSNNMLFVTNAIPHGATFDVYAKIGEKESNVLSYQVGVKINSITIETSATSVKKGNTASLTATLNDGATEGYNWVITQGNEYASISNNTLSVKEKAETGAIIKVKAVSASGEASSDEIEIVIAATDMEILENTYYLVLSFDYADLDKNGKTNPVLEAEVYNRLGTEIKDKNVIFELHNGSEAFVGIEKVGNSCRFTELKAHGTAYLNAKIEGLGVVETVELNVIVPPDVIYLPEVFAENPNFTYVYSMENPLNQEAEKLPFVAYAVTATACDDIVYSFTHEDGTTDNDVAIYNYETGTIEFLKTGLVTVTALSNSGSRIETKASYKFNINKGFNVYSFEHASQVTSNSGDYKNNKYNGEEINFVALEKIVGYNFENANYNYGYAFVPQVALKSQAEQRGNIDSYSENMTHDEKVAAYASLRNTMSSSNNRIIADTKNLHINGNQHAVDASNLYVPTDTEIERFRQIFGSDWFAHGGIISAEPYSLKKITGDVNSKVTFSVRIYDLEVIGNAPMSLANKEDASKTVWGVYLHGINVGDIDSGPNAKYYTELKNVTASAAKNAINIVGAVGNSVFENVYVHNCYQNGIQAKSSILTIKNFKIGACGATGIELVPDGSTKAGLNSDQKQTITFEGTIDAEGNIHATTTPYMIAYNDGAVPKIISASILFNQLTDEQKSHVITSDSKISLAVFILDYGVMGGDSNGSQAIYAAYQQGGIIDATEIKGIDTTHQFINLKVFAGQDMPYGNALLYNLNYGKTA